MRKHHLALLVIGLSVIIIISVFFSSSGSKTKPIILYVNQGNGKVDESNFNSMLQYALRHGFNTIFFQVYREGQMLFNNTQLEYFVNEAHHVNLRIFFSFYITEQNQTIPNYVFALNEDGINLDMSSLDIMTQQNILIAIKKLYSGLVAVTTDNMNYPLKPDMLILETYYPEQQIFIRPGIIASVGVFTTRNYTQYMQEFSYALNNSDGVMVFDYAGMLKKGY